MVEGVVLKKALGGDQKAIEFWLKYRGRMGADVGMSDGLEGKGADYLVLAQMIGE